MKRVSLDNSLIDYYKRCSCSVLQYWESYIPCFSFSTSCFPCNPLPLPPVVLSWSIVRLPVVDTTHGARTRTHIPPHGLRRHCLFVSCVNPHSTSSGLATSNIKTLPPVTHSPHRCLPSTEKSPKTVSTSLKSITKRLVPSAWISSLRFFLSAFNKSLRDR